MKQNVITVVNLHNLIMIGYCIGLLNEGPQKNISDFPYLLSERQRESTKAQSLLLLGEEHIMSTGAQCVVLFKKTASGIRL